MKKILLINPYSYPKISSGKLSRFLAPMPPIGLAYLLAVLEQGGYDPLFYDDFLERGHNERLETFIRTHIPDIVGFPLFTSPVVYRVSEMVSIIRKIVPQVTIVFGNLHAMVFGTELLQRHEADVIVRGEGESVMCELVGALSTGRSLSSVRGIIYRSVAGEVITTPAALPPQDLDKLPFPAWHRMPIERYDFLLFEKISNKQMFILPSRGCPFQCNFCSSATLQGAHRRVRSVQNIISEMEWLDRVFGYRVFSFMGPAFPLSKAEGMLFCREIEKKGLHKKYRWITQTRIDCLDQELLQSMYSAGCRKIIYGIESGSQNVLDAVNKRMRLSAVKDVVAKTRQVGISAVGLFVIGLPGECKEDIISTIKLACTLDLDTAKFAVFVPYPGTPFFSQLKAENKLDTASLYDWDSYTTDPTEHSRPVYLNEHLTIKDIVSLQSRAYVQFYLRLRIILRQVRSIPVLGAQAFKDILLYFLREIPRSLFSKVMKR